jgi:hypothetical protein
MICEVHGRKIVSLEKTTYSDGNLAVLAVWDDGERHAVSVNIPDQAGKLGEGEFFLKNWSESEELAKALFASGKVIDSGATVQTGYVEAPIARLHDNDTRDDGEWVAEERYQGTRRRK